MIGLWKKSLPMMNQDLAIGINSVPCDANFSIISLAVVASTAHKLHKEAQK